MRIVNAIKKRMNNIKADEILYSLAGVNSRVLNKPEFEFTEERIKYKRMGAILLVPFLLSLVSSGYAMFVFSGSYFLSGLIGIGYSGVVLITDQLLVFSIKKEYAENNENEEKPIQKINRLISKAMVFSVRMGLSVLVSLLISKPLEVYLFRVEIIKELAPKLIKKQSLIIDDLDKQQEENRKNYEGQVKEANKSIEDLIAHIGRNKSLQTESMNRTITQREEIREKIKKEGDLKSSEIEEQKKVEISIRNSIREAKKTYDIISIRNISGFFEQLSELEQMSYSDSGKLTDKGIANIIIICFLILLDSAPIIAKTFVIRYGLYNAVVDRNQSKRVRYHKRMEESDNQKIDEDIKRIKETRASIKIDKFANELNKKINEKLDRDINVEANTIGEDIMRQIKLSVEEEMMNVSDLKLLSFYQLIQEYGDPQEIDLNLAKRKYIQHESQEIMKDILQKISQETKKISSSDPGVKRQIIGIAKDLVVEKLSELIDNQGNGQS
jgi:Domain of unknown function (DUF4407)